MTVPFPPTEGEFRARQIAIAPDGVAYVVPSGMHERLRQAVVPEQEGRDPKVALALSGWICLQTSGMTDRINVDAPDELTDTAPIRRFARAHDAGSVAIALHPSREIVRSADPTAFEFEGAAETEGYRS